MGRDNPGTPDIWSVHRTLGLKPTSGLDDPDGWRELEEHVCLLQMML